MRRRIKKTHYITNSKGDTIFTFNTAAVVIVYDVKLNDKFDCGVSVEIGLEGKFRRFTVSPEILTNI